MKSLHVLPVTPDRYSAFDNEDSLEYALSTQSDNTEVVPIPEPSVDLRLTAKGCPLGLRFSQAAFAAICGRLAPGLGQVVLDVAGLRPATVELPTSPAAALDVFNSLVRLRADETLRGYSLVVDRETSVAEGLIGPGYRALSNADFIGMVRDLVPDGCRLSRAALQGRSVTALFRHPGSSFTAGYYFANSDAGETGVKAGRALVHADGAFSLDRPASGRVVHAGRDVRRRALTMARRAVGAPSGDTSWPGNILKKAGLDGLALPTYDPRKRRQTLETLSARIAALCGGTPGQLVRQALLSRFLTTEVGNLSRYDVFVALAEEAARRSPLAAEMAARAAHTVLVRLKSIRSEEEGSL